MHTVQLVWSGCVRKVRAGLWRVNHSWQLFWRRPMIRFVCFLSLLIVIGAWVAGGILHFFLPQRTTSVDSSLPRPASQKTALRQLLQWPSKPTPISQKQSRQWIACDDVRRVLFDTDRWYVGCRGGVLIMRPDGTVLQQFSQADGLSNDIVTDLVLVKKKLVVGTQDGINIINLESGQVIPLRVSEGLVNGSNVTLAADGDTVWVGTFDGVSRIDLPTLKITNYRTELLEGATNFNVHRITVTEKAVYISLIGSAYSPGGVARFDKRTQQFEQYPAARFLTQSENQPSIINYINIVSIKNTLLLQDGNLFWTAEDTQNLRLKPQQHILAALSDLSKVSPDQLGSVELLGAVDDQAVIRFFMPNSIEQQLLYAPATKTFRLVAEADPLQPLVMALTRSRPATDTRWLPITDRPVGIGSLLGAINNEIWMSAPNGVWSLELETGIFTQRLSWGSESDSGGDTWLLPLPGTHQALLGKQLCGMGCLQPEFWLVSWPDKQFTSLKLTDEDLALFQFPQTDISALNYQPLVAPIWDATTQTVLFTLGDKKIGYQPATGMWQRVAAVGEAAPLGDTTQQIRCHITYQTDSVGVLAAVTDACPNQVALLRVGDFAFSIGHGQNASDDWLLDGTGKKIDQIVATEKIYSPFPGWIDPIRVVSWSSDADSIWLAHNRGIARYFPATATWQLYSNKAGLAGQIVQDMIVLPDWLVVLSRGGVAVLPKTSTASGTAP